MAEASTVGADTFNRSEERVARAEADDDLSGLGCAHADQAGRIIARTDDDFALGREAVAMNEVSRDGTSHRSTWTDRRQLISEAWGGGGECCGRPVAFADVHQVHPRPITCIDRRILTG